MSTEAGGHSKALLYYLTLTAVVCGGLVMVLEVLGSRVIGPFFGVSLFIWTSLITVTLVALAAGYAAGGIVSDRRNNPAYLYVIILIAGLLIIAIPFVKLPVLKSCQSLGLRSGAFLSATLLFGPPLFFLGCVSPYIIRLAAKETVNIGRTVGVFYALSTMGSVLGTVLTGFVLIAYFRVNTIFMVIGFLLVCLSALFFLVFQKKQRALLLFFLLVPLFFFAPGPVKSKVWSNGITVTELYGKDSFYGALKVFDYSGGLGHIRELMIDGLVQGGIDMDNRLSIYEYHYFMEHLPYAVNRNGKTCLVIGLGAGIVPMWYESMGIKTDVVDINPDIVDVAGKYFGFGISGDMIVEDARSFLAATGKKYDYIILDVFNGDTTPAHLLSVESLQLVKNALSEQGILGINLIGSLREETFMTASIIKTIGTVFGKVELYPIFSPEEGDGIGSIEVIAYDYPFPPADFEAEKGFPVHPMAAEQTRRFFGRRFLLPPETAAVVLSDDYNPIDFYDIRLKEALRKRIIENTDWDILI